MLSSDKTIYPNINKAKNSPILLPPISKSSDINKGNIKRGINLITDRLAIFNLILLLSYLVTIGIAKSEMMNK
ncbi:hypothetical protein D3C81_1338930 [compost metagenome]